MLLWVKPESIAIVGQLNYTLLSYQGASSMELLLCKKTSIKQQVRGSS